MFASLIAQSLRAAINANTKAAFDAYLNNPSADNFNAIAWAALAHQQAWPASDEALLRTVRCPTLEDVAKALAPGLTLAEAFVGTAEPQASADTKAERIVYLESLLIRINNYNSSVGVLPSLLAEDIRNALNS